MRINKMLHGSALRNEEIEVAGEVPAVDVSTLPSLVDADLNFIDGYQARIGEHAEGSTFKNLGDVFKSSKEAQRTITQLNQDKADLTKQLGEDKPVAEALPVDAAAFKEALTLPELPEGMSLEDGVLDKAINFAMDKGYGPEALADFLAFDLERASMETAANETADFAKLGAAKDIINGVVGEQNYDMTVADAQFVSESLALPLESADLLNQPNLIIALSKLRSSLSEGTLKGATLGGVEVSGGSKLAQASDIISNPANALNAAFHDNSHPQFQAAQMEHARLISESAG
jgi:hypothetical protein